MACQKASECEACTMGEIKARAFVRTFVASQEYYNRVDSRWVTREDIGMPPLDLETKWKVYKYSSTKKFKHFSIFFKCADLEYQNSPGFTMELCVATDEAEDDDNVADDDSVNASVVLETVLVWPSKDKLSELGAVTMSAKDIMETGLDCLAAFGNYNKITHNCQDYCSMLAKELGIQVLWTDAEKTALMGVAAGVGGAVVLGVLGGIAALFLKGRNKDD